MNQPQSYEPLSDMKKNCETPPNERNAIELSYICNSSKKDLIDLKEGKKDNEEKCILKSNSRTNISNSDEIQSKSNSYEFVKIFNEDSVFLTATKTSPRSSNHFKEIRIQIPPDTAD